MKSYSIMIVAISMAMLLWSGCVGVIHKTEKERAYKIPPPTESVNRGKSLYEQFCMDCHGEDGKGAGPKAVQLEKPPADLTKSGVHVSRYGLTTIVDFPHYSSDIIKTKIEEGNKIMPPLKEKLKQLEIDDVTNYVLHLIYGEKAPN